MAGSSWPSARADSTSKPSSRRIRFTSTVSPTFGSSSSEPANARTTSRNGLSRRRDGLAGSRHRRPHRRRRADGPGAGPVADAAGRARADRRQDGGAGDDVARAGRAGAHARALPPDRPRRRGRRAWTAMVAPQSLGGRQAGGARRLRRHGRGHQSVSVRADLSAGRARAPADRSPGPGRRRRRAPDGARGVRGGGAAVCAPGSSGRMAPTRRARPPTSRAATARIPRVREALAIGFPGGTYDHLFYVADVEARGAGDERRAARRARHDRFSRRLSAEGRRARAAHRHRARRMPNSGTTTCRGTTSAGA